MTNYIKSFSLATDTMAQTLSPKGISVAQYNQGDVNTDTLNLTITHNNSVMDLTGASVSVVFSKPDGKIVYQDTTNGVTVTNATQGQLSISLNTQTRAAVGTVVGAVRVTYPNNQILETEKFSFNVEQSLASDQAIASVNDVSGLIGTATLTTNAKDIKGAINEVNADLAEIAQWINVRDAQYGAKGDGTTDDTAAFQAAFNATSFTKRNVFIPEGNYVINGTIDLTGKSYLNVFCLGKILMGSNNNIFNVNNANYNTFTGVYAQSQSGVTTNGALYYIQGSSTYNTFLNHKIQNIANYAWIIDNSGSSQPIANTIDGVDCIYTNGLIKSITPSTVFGAEISIKRIRCDAVQNGLNQTNFPAFIWLTHTHDILIEDILGVHQFSCILIEGDSNANISDFNLTGLNASTIQFTTLNSKPCLAIQLTNGLLWGPNGGTTAQLQIDNVTTFNASNVRIDNSHIGILQGSKGDYFFDNIVVNNCDQYIAFNSNWTYTDITNLYFNIGKFGGTSLSRTLMTSSVGLGVLQNLSVYFKNIQMRIANGYSMADSPKLIHFRDCDIDSVSYAQIRQKAVFINEDTNTSPTLGILLVGQKLYYTNPTAGGNIGQVCTTQGAFFSKTWAASTAFTKGDWVQTSANGKVYLCTVGGTSGTTAPDYGTPGNTGTDGTVTWQYMGGTGVVKAFGVISA